MPETSQRTSHFTESIIRRMTRVANACDAVNLSQGFPDFNPPEALLAAAERAGRDGLVGFYCKCKLHNTVSEGGNKCRCILHNDYCQ